MRRIPHALSRPLARRHSVARRTALPLCAVAASFGVAAASAGAAGSTPLAVGRSPAIQSLSATSGSTLGGRTVTIRGTGLDLATSVSVGGKQVVDRTTVSPTELKITVPPAAPGKVDISITDGLGAVSANTPADDFTYRTPAVSPESALPLGDDLVFISGVDLSGVVGVWFGGVESREVTREGDGSLSVFTPTLPAGLYRIEVEYADGSRDLVIEEFDVNFREPSPEIRSISPSTGPVEGGTAVTIRGFNMRFASGVKFGTQPAQFTVSSDRELVAIAPPGATGKVDISIQGGIFGNTQNTPTDDFTYFRLGCDASVGSGCSPGWNYGVAGTATLKTLVKGSVPLSGEAKDFKVDPASGAVSAAITFAAGQAKLTALGFLPVSAKVLIVPTTPLTGTLTGRYGEGVLTASTKVRIKLPAITLLGLQLALVSNCQTKYASNIVLGSTTPFSVPEGGALAGTFTISDLTGCGVLNGLVSTLTAGGNNAIALNLTPKA